MSSLPTTSDPQADLSSILNRLLRITIPDGRYFIGRFTCVDHQLNIVLTQAEEFRPDPKTDEEKENRDRVDAFMPKSQRGAGEGDGWGIYAKYDEDVGDVGYVQGQDRASRTLNGRVKEGRMLGMILITQKDVVTIDLIDETGNMQNGAAGGMGETRMMSDIM
jgi:small nuclear ribonucleoprotein (snRNP)-like protein